MGKISEKKNIWVKLLHRKTTKIIVTMSKNVLNYIAMII